MSGSGESRRVPGPPTPGAALSPHPPAARGGVLPSTRQREPKQPSTPSSCCSLFRLSVHGDDDAAAAAAAAAAVRPTRRAVQPRSAAPLVTDAASFGGEGWKHRPADRRVLWEASGRVDGDGEGEGGGGGDGEGQALRGPADLPGPDFPPAAGDDGNVAGGAAGRPGAEQQEDDGPLREVKILNPPHHHHQRYFIIFTYSVTFAPCVCLIATTA